MPPAPRRWSALELSCRSLAGSSGRPGDRGGGLPRGRRRFPARLPAARALSRSGESRPFSADADGLIPGEGVGVVVLKRLRDAERAGDRIYAVLEGVGLASDGRGRGLDLAQRPGPCPRDPPGLPGCRDRAVDRRPRRGPRPGGAGRRSRRAAGPCVASFPPEGGARGLGPSSSQIGHAMPAAGMAGLIKTALSLHHRVLPPTRHADRPNPLLDGSGLELVASPRPWIQGDPRRRAAPGSTRSASPGSTATRSCGSIPRRPTG